MIKFEYSPDVVYDVYADDLHILQTVNSGRLPITNALKVGVSMMMAGKTNSVIIRGNGKNLYELTFSHKS